MHIVLDLYCRTNAVVDIHTVAYEVYKVKKKGDLYVLLFSCGIVTKQKLATSRSSTALPAILLACAATRSAGALINVDWYIELKKKQQDSQDRSQMGFEYHSFGHLVMSSNW